MNVLQHTRNELNLCLKQNRPDRSYRDTLLRYFGLSFGWRENQTPRAFTLHLGHLKSLSVRRISSLRQFAPIQKASVLLLLSLRPETL